MTEIHSIAGFTGTVELVDQDGGSREVWCQAGVIQLGDDSGFMVVPAPLPGHCWAQIEINTKEGQSDQ